MGIVNLNDDSFTEDGTLDVNRRSHLARKLVSEGAISLMSAAKALARIGGKSLNSRKSIGWLHSFVRFQECYEGLLPFDDVTDFPALLSVNTWRSPVASTLLSLGGDLLNDMSALSTDENACIAARHHTAITHHAFGRFAETKHTMFNTRTSCEPWNDFLKTN